MTAIADGGQIIAKIANIFCKWRFLCRRHGAGAGGTASAAAGLSRKAAEIERGAVLIAADGKEPAAHLLCAKRSWLSSTLRS